jgi:Protein of unknown function (DUF3253)
MSGNLDSSSNPVVIRQEITRQINALAQGKSICPSDVARALAGSHPDVWSRAMPHVRRVAVEMAKEGNLVVLRKGKIVDPEDFRGVYRLGAPRQD